MVLQSDLGRGLDHIKVILPIYVPVRVADALERAAVAAVLVLEARPHHLVRVRGHGGEQLGHRREEDVLGGSLKRGSGEFMEE